MKRLWLTLLFMFICSSILYGQNNIAPQDLETRTRNCVFLMEVFTHMEIPIFLTNKTNTKIKYCWYETKEVFGEKVRISETPYRTFEGTYIDGKLSMYKRYDAFYKFNYLGGRIVEIIKYNAHGDLVKKYNGNDYDYFGWRRYESISRSKKGVHRVELSNVLLTDFKYPDSYIYQISLTGYTIEEGYLVKKFRKWSLNQVSRDFIGHKKVWRNYDSDEKRAVTYIDGRLGKLRPYVGNDHDIFDPSDVARCTSFIEY